MNLTAFSVKNWQFTVIVFAMLAVLGLASWHSVPRMEDPALDFPTYTIVAVYPGASPIDLERLVVTKIEEHLDKLENVKHIDSHMRDGVATVKVEFEEDQDVDKKYDEVVREINALRPELPSELARLDINKATTLEVNIVQAGSGDLVRVGDIARVSWSYADSTYRARFNGRRAVFVTANQQADITVGAVRDRIYDELDSFAARLPAGVTLERGFDQARNVSHRLARLGEDFLIAIGLVLVTLLPLGGRSSLIVMISIPLSLAMGLTALHAFGYSLNQLTIVGMVIALGLLVDDSIVVVENIARYRRQGYGRVEAAIAATKQIWVAVLGATATLIAAFVPLLVLPGGPGRFIRVMPATVIATIVSSFIVSITIIPWLASRLLPEHEDARGNRVLRAFDRTIHRTYAPLLDWALRRPRATLAVAAAFAVYNVALVPVIGFSLFPKAETPQVYVNITAPEGASIAVTDSAARFAERVIGRRPEVRAVYTSVGHDNPMIYYNITPRVVNPRVGQLFVLLDEYDQHQTPALLDTLRAELARYQGAEIALREFENGPPVDAPIALRIMPPDLDTFPAAAPSFPAGRATT